MSRIMYDLKKEPRGGVYRKLLEYALPYCNRLVLVVVDRGLKSAGERVMEDLAPFLLEQGRRSDWPGTKMSAGHFANVYHYRYCLECLEVLTHVTDGLYDWQQFDRPEFPCLLRPDGSPWLVTLTCDEEAYLELTPGEKDDLQKAIPTLDLVAFSEETAQGTLGEENRGVDAK